MIGRVPCMRWKYGERTPVKFSYKEIKPLPETVLKVEPWEKFYGFSPPLPYLIPFQWLPFVKCNWKPVNKRSSNYSCRAQSFRQRTYFNCLLQWIQGIHHKIRHFHFPQISYLNSSLGGHLLAPTDESAMATINQTYLSWIFLYNSCQPSDLHITYW